MKVNVKVKYPDNLARAVESLENAAKEARQALTIIEKSIVVEKVDTTNGGFKFESNTAIDLGE